MDRTWSLTLVRLCQVSWLPMHTCRRSEDESWEGLLLLLVMIYWYGTDCNRSCSMVLPAVFESFCFTFHIPQKMNAISVILLARHYRIVNLLFWSEYKSFSRYKPLFKNIKAQIQIEQSFLTGAFSILEEQPMEMLLGLDILKRHQVD